MLDQTAILIAAIVAIPTVLATTLVPLLLKRADNALRRQERAEDKAALNEAAVKAEEVAAQAREAARLLAQNTIKSEEATKLLTDKVDVVHTLVNSNLTETTKKLRDAKQRTLSLIETFEANKRDEIDMLKLEIAELDAELADRIKQTKAAEGMQARQQRQ